MEERKRGQPTIFQDLFYLSWNLSVLDSLVVFSLKIRARANAPSLLFIRFSSPVL